MNGISPIRCGLAQHSDLFKGVNERQDRFSLSGEIFRIVRKDMQNLPKSVIHNDANDHNLVVSNNLERILLFRRLSILVMLFFPKLSMILLCACAYGIMGQDDPLSAALAIVKGFDQGRKPAGRRAIALSLSIVSP